MKIKMQNTRLLLCHILLASGSIISRAITLQPFLASAMSSGPKTCQSYPWCQARTPQGWALIPSGDLPRARFNGRTNLLESQPAIMYVRIWWSVRSGRSQGTPQHVAGLSPTGSEFELTLKKFRDMLSWHIDTEGGYGVPRLIPYGSRGVRLINRGFQDDRGNHAHQTSEDHVSDTDFSPGTLLLRQTDYLLGLLQLHNTEVKLPRSKPPLLRDLDRVAQLSDHIHGDSNHLIASRMYRLCLTTKRA
ncbi:hypothetical protein BDV97DRAFT_372104 [Delphinella strobiligena]|nr:hypothetical protein BDV97DRAFT_372104 [Delphinella strobiligena]